MEIAPLVPDDAPEINRLGRQWEQQPWVFSPGAHGVVVRDGSELRAFCLLRETAHGFVVDELWCERAQGRRGKIALGMIANWLESTVQAIATERGSPVKLGGIVRLDNPAHRRALERRGFSPVALVLSKNYTPKE